MKEYDEVVPSRDFLSKTDCSALSVEMSLAEGGLPVSHDNQYTQAVTLL